MISHHVQSYFVKCGIVSYCIILCYIFQYDSISYDIILYDTMLCYILIILPYDYACHCTPFYVSLYYTYTLGVYPL